MPTGTVLLPIGAAILPDGSASNLAPAIQNSKSSAGAPTPYLLQAAFDATNDEILMWNFRMPANYLNSPVLKIQYKMASATSGSTRWEGYIQAVTPADSQDVDADGFAATNNAGSTVPGTAGHMAEVSITLTNADSLAAGDFVTVRLNRDADQTSGTDDATGDAEVIAVSLEYQTT